MFSFFKRKKKPDTPATEAAQQPADTAKTPAPHTETHHEAGHIPVGVDSYEKNQPLSSHTLDTLKTDAATHPVSNTVADVVGNQDKLPEQYHPQAEAEPAHQPESEKPTPAAAQPVALDPAPHTETHLEAGHIPVSIDLHEKNQPLSSHTLDTLKTDAATHPVSNTVADVVGNHDKLPEQYHPQAEAEPAHQPESESHTPAAEQAVAPPPAPHIETHLEAGHIPIGIDSHEAGQPLSSRATEALSADAGTNPVSELVTDIINPQHGLPEQYDPEAPKLKVHLQPSETDSAAETAEGFNANTMADTLKQPESLATIAAAVPAAAAVAEEPAKLGWAARLKKGLTKSRDQMAKSLAGVFGGGKIDEDLYEELETVLITSDMGIEATEYLMNDVRKRVSLKGLSDGHELRETLKDAIYDLIKPLEQPLVIPERSEPFVIMLAGINGAGKTTSIGKLAKYFQAQGKSVLLAAGDTFRAAAREQLQEWGARNGVTVISQASGDSAAVCFDAVEAAKARGIDIVLADTAGRLPTQLHLMEEIKKVKRVLQKAMPDAPHETIVVLDANIGQNAVNQVVAFDDALGLTGLIVTKLDGTAKGGVLAALASSRPIPVRYIGVGESIDDLRPFDARAFVDALFD